MPARQPGDLRCQHPPGLADGVSTPRTLRAYTRSRSPERISRCATRNLSLSTRPSIFLHPAEDALRHFRRVTIGGFDLARVAARNSRILLAKGLPAPSTLECLIATFALENHWNLLHASPGYEPFEQHLGLKVPSLGP